MAKVSTMISRGLSKSFCSIFKRSVSSMRINQLFDHLLVKTKDFHWMIQHPIVMGSFLHMRSIGLHENSRMNTAQNLCLWLSLISFTDHLLTNLKGIVSNFNWTAPNLIWQLCVCLLQNLNYCQLAWNGSFGLLGIALLCWFRIRLAVPDCMLEVKKSVVNLNWIYRNIYMYIVQPTVEKLSRSLINPFIHIDRVRIALFWL